MTGSSATRGAARARRGLETTPDQSKVTARYDRLASLYDLYTGPMEWLGLTARRRRLLARARGSVLEAGIGTGRNLRHYPEGVHLVGIDASAGMLARAGKRAGKLELEVRLERADVRLLPFDDRSFDTAVATCLFCSVPDPVRGLSELGRVVTPEAQILLLEHVRPHNPLLARLADLLSPLTTRLFGFNLNRRTEENVLAAGLEISEVRRSGIWREIVARRPARMSGSGPR